jgi:hypothetical protein
MFKDLQANFPAWETELEASLFKKREFYLFNLN